MPERGLLYYFMPKFEKNHSFRQSRVFLSRALLLTDLGCASKCKVKLTVISPVYKKPTKNRVHKAL